MMMKYLLLLNLFLISGVAHALEIDEKLTLRFLKVSNSKKTVLINRGSEDGLAIGDHAKFFVTSGVIARGVTEKVSPSRSIWSLYRVVDANEITDGKVLNLKIASPVKITKDPSKSMKDDEVPAGNDKMSMNDSESGTDVSSGLDDSEKKELDGLGVDEGEKNSKKSKTEKVQKETKKDISMEERVHDNFESSKNWDIWGMLYVNSLSGSVSNPSPTPTSSTSSKSSTIDFSAGLERYFFSSSGFLKDTSVIGFVHKRTVETGKDYKINTDWFEFGGGVNYHFYNSITSIGKPIGFATFCAGLGNATIIEQFGDTGTPDQTKGTNKFISVGIGSKYIVSGGFGLRALLDYYSSNETYTFSNSTSLTRTLAGPRIQVGLSYRF